MKIAVLGTGSVGTTIGDKLIALGHEVMMGSRDATNPKAAAWVEAAGAGASQGTFADAAAFAEVLFNCTAGLHSVAAIEAAGAGNLAGKLLLDLSNPLDFSAGFPPRLNPVSSDSLGEQLQRAVPALKVVKTLNTMAAPIMVDPSLVPGDHVVFVSGDDAEAKAQATMILTEGFGWKHVVDLGDITTARGTEGWLLLWTRLYGALGTPFFNLELRMGKQG